MYMAASSRDMAESPTPNKANKEELLSKSIQELVINGGQLLDNYVYKNSTGGVPDVHTPLNEIPVIDLGNLKSSVATVVKELEKLQSALSSWGCFQIMSNGIFKSPVHRVVTNSERERISVAVFSSPDSDKEIEPIGRLFNDSRPRLYKKVKNYVDTYFQYYQQGKRPIDAVR